ncbi:MAG TPA: hypothetical protein VGN42_08430 [Pirellulales bacterium]|nr:hypothetical protein [Pirellulales bacterium]
MAKRKQDEREAIKVIEAAGGRILYDWQSAEREPPTDDPTPSGPAWLRRLIGDDFFQAAEEVSVLRLAAPKEPTILNLIPSLRQLPCLKVVIVPPMSEEGRRELRAALPNCRLWSPGAAVP